jgi:hypothetical protein
MMTSISGDRGIGKTAYLAKRVYEHARNGYLVFTNFSHYYSHVDLSKGKPSLVIEVIKQLGIFKERGYEPCDLIPTLKHSGIYMAIDEGHLYFPAKAGAARGDDFAVIKFLAQARKQDVWIEYTTQHPDKIGKDWRRYTEDYVRLRAVLPFKKWILVPRFRGKGVQPVWQREMRITVPLIWEEMHKLQADSTDFNYTMRYEDGRAIGLHPSSTLQSRRMFWQKKFYFKLYNSRQMLSMDSKEDVVDFSELLKVSYIDTDRMMKPELFPTFKKLFHMRRNDEIVPIRKRVKHVTLPTLQPEYTGNSIMQPEELIDNLMFLNKRKGKTIALFSSLFPSPATPFTPDKAKEHAAPTGVPLLN